MAYECFVPFASFHINYHGQLRYALYSAIQVNASQPIGEPFNAVDEMDTDYSDDEEHRRHLMAVAALMQHCNM